MPESKRIFQSGRMNLDLDDRLIPNGEYRYGLNVNIGRSEGADIGAVENLLGNEEISFGTTMQPPTGSECIGVYRDNGNEIIYFFVTDYDDVAERTSTDPTDFHAIYEFNQVSRSISMLASGNWLNFHKNYRITGINLAETLLLWTDNRNEPRRINIIEARNDRTLYTSDDQAAVIKFHPFLSPTILSVSTTTRQDEQGRDLPRSNFLQRRLIRFSYRYRYVDGEFSTLAPFSTTCFNPDPSNTEAYAPDFTNAGGSGEVGNFLNQIQQIRVSVPIPTDRSLEIEAVELIWKEQTNTTVYIVEELPVIPGRNTLEFTYTSQDPFRALPASQITRVSDAVPRLAQSQEFAGGRLVYGNFLHQFNLPNINFVVRLADDASRYPDDDGGNTRTARHPVFGFHSLKQGRTYQVGITLQDRFGRQTPIILSSSGSDTVATPFKTGDRDAGFTALEVQVLNWDEIRQSAPWAYSYKIWVKAREQEYYNVFTEFTSVAAVPNVSATARGYRRSGDTINKVPVDTTQAAGGIAAPSTETLYQKLPNIENPALTVVQGINTTVNPSVFTIPGNDDATPTNIDVDVFETSPFESNLDIFFETSTGGEIPTEESTIVPVDFFNCFLVNVTAGANITGHLEFNRIRAGFNEPFFDTGVRASLVVEEYSEERRLNTLIHSSGFFNSRTGLNGLNQFNQDEGGLTVSLDPQDGSIQKLFAEDTQLIIWQEDKVSRSPIDKDFIYSAEGGAVPVTSNSQYLGTIAPYAGEYGISRDPGSFAVYGTRKYFTDRNRGVVMRLSNDGLTEISGSGMNDFFRDALRTSTDIVASFDEYHDVYNLTINGQNYQANEDTNIVTASQDYFTVAYEEDVQGWSSFKSFKQECGTTLNNRYYTFSGGDIYEHNSENVPRNQFYGARMQSEVEFVFNDNPSLVKDFKTLGYEGSGAWDCEFLEADGNVLPGSTVPEVPQFGTVNLNVDRERIVEARLSGDVQMTAVVGTEVTWRIFVESDRATRTFSSLGMNSLLEVEGENSGVMVGQPLLNVEEGRIYWDVRYTITSTETVDINLVAVAVSDSAIVGDILTVLFENTIGELYRYGRSAVGFPQASFIDGDGMAVPATVNYAVTPSAGYYFSDLDQVPVPNFGLTDIVADSYTGSSNTETPDSFDLEFMVNGPDSVTNSTVVLAEADPVRYTNITFRDPVIVSQPSPTFTKVVTQFLTNADGEGMGTIPESTGFILADPARTPQNRNTSARLNLALTANDNLVWDATPEVFVNRTVDETTTRSELTIMSDADDPSIFDVDEAVAYNATDDTEYSFEVIGGTTLPAALSVEPMEFRNRSLVAGNNIGILVNEASQFATLVVTSNLQDSRGNDNYEFVPNPLGFGLTIEESPVNNTWNISTDEVKTTNGRELTTVTLAVSRYPWAPDYNNDPANQIEIAITRPGPVYFEGQGVGDDGLAADFSINNTASTYNLNVFSTSGAATAVSSETWLTPTVAAGTIANGYTETRVELAAEATTAERTATLTITVGGEDFPITITQNA